MAQSKTRNSRNRESRPGSKLKLVVEVDGKPIGVLDIDWDRLWPEVNHRNRESIGIEWVDGKEIEARVKTTMLSRFTRRLEPRLYQSLGDEMVRAELDIENFFLRLEAAGQAFGTSRKAVDRILRSSDATQAEFMEFLWEYVVSDAEIDLIEETWKAVLADRKPSTGRQARKSKPS